VSTVTKASPTADWVQADALLRRGEWREAEQAFRRLLLRRPGDTAVLNGLGLALKGAQAWPEAEEVLRRAASLAPFDPALRNNLGNVLLASGNLAGAMAAYREALAIDIGYAEAHYNLGVTLERSREPEAALAAYRDAVQYSPGHVRAQTRIGALLHERRRYAEAIAALEQGLAADPDSFEARYYRGRALSAAGRHEAALEDLKRCVEQRPDSYEAAFAHALALREAGRHEDALTALTAVTERWPAQVQAHVELNRLAWTRGRRPLFLKSFSAVRTRVLSPELLIAEAGFRMRLNQHAEAERLLREAGVLAPRRADVAGLLGRALAGQGRFVDSVEALARAIHAEPDAITHRQELGFALLKMGKFERAAEAFEQALRLDGADQLALAGLALAWRELDDARYFDLWDPKQHVRAYDLFEGESEARRASFNAELAEELRRLHNTEVEPIDQTVHGGTQTTVVLFDQPLPAVQELRRRIERAVGDYIGRIPAAPGHPFAGRKSTRYAFSGSWSCRLRSGGYHSNHIHPAGWVSSAYYVAVPESVRDTNAHSGWFVLGQSNQGLGEHDRPEQILQPAVGRLLLFPSYCWHGTIPFTDPAERLGVAFDVVPAFAPKP